MNTASLVSSQARKEKPWAGAATNYLPTEGVRCRGPLRHCGIVSPESAAPEALLTFPVVSGRLSEFEPPQTVPLSKRTAAIVARVIRCCDLRRFKVDDKRPFGCLSAGP